MITAALLLLSSCVPERIGTDVFRDGTATVNVQFSFSRDVPDTRTKEQVSPADESRIESFQILVYHYGTLWDSAWNVNTLEVPVGQNRVVIFANMERIDPPATYDELSQVTSLASSSFGPDKDHYGPFAMYGDETVNITHSTTVKAVSLRRIAAKVTVRGIRNAMLRESDGDECYISQVFLANVAGDWHFGSPAAPSVWHNKLGRTTASADSRYTDDVGSSSFSLEKAGNPYGDTHTFYPYPNPCTGTDGLDGPWSPRRTVLVVSAYKEAPEENGSPVDNPEYLLYYTLPPLKENTDYVIDDLVLTRWTMGEDFIVYPEDLGELHWGDVSEEIRIRYTDPQGGHHYRSLSEVTITIKDDDDNVVVAPLSVSGGRITFNPDSRCPGDPATALTITVTDNATGLSSSVTAAVHDPSLDSIVEVRPNGSLASGISVYGPLCQYSRNLLPGLIRWCPGFEKRIPLDEEHLSWELPEGVSRNRIEGTSPQVSYFLDFAREAPAGAGKSITVTEASGAAGTATFLLKENRSALQFRTGTVKWQPNAARSISLGHYQPAAFYYDGDAWDFLDDSGDDWTGKLEEFTENIPVVGGTPILHTNLSGWTGATDSRLLDYQDNGLVINTSASVPEGQYTYSMHIKARIPSSVSGYPGTYWFFDQTASLTCLVGTFSGLSFNRSQYSIRQDKWRDVRVTYVGDSGDVETGLSADKWVLSLVVTGYSSGSTPWEEVIPITGRGHSGFTVHVPSSGNMTYFTVQYDYNSSTDTFSFKQDAPVFNPAWLNAGITSYKFIATTTDGVSTAEAAVVFADMPASSGEGDDGGDQEITY